jgi:DNA-binding NarL/FixJ family response regulator
MRVLIADDHPIFRAGLKETLAKESDVDAVGEADNGHKQSLQRFQAAGSR